MKILCPTDFSEHSLKALDYAIGVVNAFNADLHIISVYQVPRSTGSFGSIDEAIKTTNEEEMAKLLAGVTPQLEGDILPVAKVIRGDAVNVISKYAKDCNVDVVIMGTQGDNSMRTLLFGSVTRKVAAKCSLPILAIPETVDHKITNNKILMAVDDKILEHSESFKFPIAIAKHLNQKIDLLHISKPDEDLPFDPFISSYLEEVLGEIILKEGTDPVKEIKLYAETNNVGMIIMVRREKSFFQRLLSIGNTSEEIAKTNIPLLIIPE